MKELYPGPGLAACDTPTVPELLRLELGIQAARMSGREWAAAGRGAAP